MGITLFLFGAIQFWHFLAKLLYHITIRLKIIYFVQNFLNFKVVSVLLAIFIFFERKRSKSNSD